MRKFLLATIALVLVFSWSYLGLTQNPDSTDTNKGAVAETAENTELETLAKDMVMQQQESRENLRRLGEGQIKSFEVTNVVPDRQEVFVNTTYSNEAPLEGRIDFKDVQGKKYVTKVTRMAAITNLPGQQVATIGEEELALGRDLVKAQGENQDIPNGLLNGEITRLDINSKSRDNNGVVTLEGTASMKDGSSKPFKIEMVFLNGFWYIKSIS